MHLLVSHQQLLLISAAKIEQGVTYFILQVLAMSAAHWMLTRGSRGLRAAVSCCIATERERERERETLRESEILFRNPGRAPAESDRFMLD